MDAAPNVVAGPLNSRPNRAYALRLYSNPLGGDEGRTFRGGPLTVTTNGNGDANFVIAPSPLVPVGHTVTATATDVMSGDTSEVSVPVIVTP